MARGKLSEEQRQEICERYRAGESTYELARALGLSTGTVVYHLRKAGIPRRKTGKLTEAQKQEVVERYKMGESTYEIARGFPVSSAPIHRLVKKAGIPIRHKHRRPTESEKSEIAERYQRGESTRQLAGKFRVSRTTISRVLRKRGIKIHDGQPWKYRNKLDETKKLEIMERYKDGENIQQLAEAYSISCSSVWSLLNRRNLTRSRRLTETQKRSVVKRYQKGESTYEIAEALSIHQKTVSNTLRKKGIPIRGDVDGTKYLHKLTDSEKAEIEKSYCRGTSTHELARRFSISQAAVWKLLKGRNIEMRDGSAARFKRIYQCEEKFFEDIDSEEKAYWLGFLMADGSVSRNQLSLRLSSKDEHHIRRFRESLKSNHPIHTRLVHLSTTNREYPEAGVVMTSTNMVNDLAKWGIVPAKTLKETFPNINERFAQHFIRGVFDGDGTVAKSKKIRSQMTFSITSSETLVQEIQKRLIQMGLSKTKLLQYKRSHVLAYGGRNNLKRIYRYLYSDATIYLQRKKEAFEDCILHDKAREDFNIEREDGALLPLEYF